MVDVLRLRSSGEQELGLLIITCLVHCKVPKTFLGSLEWFEADWSVDGFVNYIRICKLLHV